MCPSSRHPAPPAPRTAFASSGILVDNQLAFAVQCPALVPRGSKCQRCGMGPCSLRRSVHVQHKQKVCIPEDCLNEVWHTVVLHYWVEGVGGCHSGPAVQQSPWIHSLFSGWLSLWGYLPSNNQRRKTWLTDHMVKNPQRRWRTGVIT